MDARAVSRRDVLGIVGAAGVGSLAGCPTGGGGGTDTPTDTGGGPTVTGSPTATPPPSGTVRIGVLQPVSGNVQYYGQQSLWGFLAGLAYKTGTDPLTDVTTGRYTVTDGDVDYELLVRDSKFSASTAQTLAADLVASEDVDLLFGCASSGAARRVISQVVGQTGVPIVLGPAASAGITSNPEYCGEKVFRASENTAMDARSGGRYVAEQTDVSSVYLFGADYSFGHAVVDNYRTVLEAHGVTIVGEKFVPPGYEQWPGLLDNAADEGAEGIVGGFTVQTLPQLFTAYLSGGYDYRVFGGFATQITNRITGTILKKTLGEPLTAEKITQAGFGPFTTRYHWNQYDNPINDAFVDAYTAAYGVVPDLFTSGTFTAASAIVQAVAESGSTEGDDVAAAMSGMTVAETPKGEGGYVFQEFNNQARSPMTVADPVPNDGVEAWDAAVMPGEPKARIPGEQATIPADSDEMNCSL